MFNPVFIENRCPHAIYLKIGSYVSQSCRLVCIPAARVNKDKQRRRLVLVCGLPSAVKTSVFVAPTNKEKRCHRCGNASVKGQKIILMNKKV